VGTLPAGPEKISTLVHTKEIVIGNWGQVTEGERGAMDWRDVFKTVNERDGETTAWL